MPRRSRQARNRCHASFPYRRFPFFHFAYLFPFTYINILSLLSCISYPSGVTSCSLSGPLLLLCLQLSILLILMMPSSCFCLFSLHCFPLRPVFSRNYFFYLVSCFRAASTQRGTILIHSIWVVILLPAVTSTFFHATWCVRNNQQPPPPRFYSRERATLD